MNAGDEPENLTEEEKLTGQRDKKLAMADEERVQLPEYLGELKDALQQQFFPRYCEGVLQDLAVVSRDQGKILQDISFIDLVSEKNGRSDDEIYRHLEAFKEAISKRSYPELIKQPLLSAVQHELNIMKPQEASSQSSLWSSLQPFVNLVMGDTSTTRVDSALLADIHALRVASDRRVPNNKRQDMQAIREGNASVDHLCDDVLQAITSQQRQFDTRTNELMDRIDSRYDQFRGSVRQSPTSVDAEFAPRLADIKRSASDSCNQFKESLNKALRDLSKELNSAYLRLILRQAYMTELINSGHLPSFALLKEHQGVQQKFLDCAVKIMLQLTNANHQYYKVECGGGFPPSIDQVCDRVKELSNVLIKLQHIQNMQRLQHDKISAICAIRQAQTPSEHSPDAPSTSIAPQSNAAAAIVPLLVAQDTNKNTPPQVRYSNTSVNKPNLAAKTMLHDGANGESFLLVQAAPNPDYQVVKLDDPQLLEQISATKFGTPVKGKISQGNVHLEKVTANKKSEGHHR